MEGTKHFDTFCCHDLVEDEAEFEPAPNSHMLMEYNGN